MTKQGKIGILGDGRIARAAAFYFRKYAGIETGFITRPGQAKSCDLLVGALPGELGEKSLELALRFSKNLIDISDVDPPFYLKNKSRIAKKNITVIPGCGFSPGLVNCIIGHEASRSNNIRDIEVMAGSLSFTRSYFPFLWCFEDLVLEHRIPSWQLLNGKKKKFSPFAGYREEKFFGIESESYYCASGFENLLEMTKAKNFFCRVVRPRGYRTFFGFLEKQGFLKKENFLATKKILEENLSDNLTLGQVSLSTPAERIVWEAKSFSSRGEKLNSMQKITSTVPAVIGKMLLENRIPAFGLLFMESLGAIPSVFNELLREIRKSGVMVSRKTPKKK